jgi:hypothetical protein
MITFDIEPANRLAVCRAENGVGVLEIANYLQALVRDPRFDPSFNSLIVAVDTTSIPTFGMLRFLDPIVATWTAQRGRAKWAVVVPNEAARALAVTELKHLTLNQVEARCFISETLAREWLGALSAPPTAPAESAPNV